MSDQNSQKTASIHWFRHGLRLHDNPALLEALKEIELFYPIFIFDGESAGTKTVGYNRMRFLTESLENINSQLNTFGGKLLVFQGSPVPIFQRLCNELNITKICFEQDCEPIWRSRDNSVKSMCQENGIECVEQVSHTLWDPRAVIKTNGGIPPLTYQMFIHTVSVLGFPPRPVEDANWTNVKFGILPDFLSDELKLIDVPTPEELGFHPEMPAGDQTVRWFGGETVALQHFEERLRIEEKAYREGYFLPNQANPDLMGRPTSQSAALRFGCISVRRFYWSLHDLFNSIHRGSPQSSYKITGQLIWREYFYTMSVDNDYYAEMSRNPICLEIPWQDGKENGHLDKWTNGKTGYPFIDAVMRQLVQEGWINHVARNAVACFLTRGDLWISWEAGLQVFLRYLIDADWSVCAGNWMWVSSSAFEKLLDCSDCVCPVNYGRRLDPWGNYIKRYVPELRNYPMEYLYEPWKASLEIQKMAGCVVGVDYPRRMIDHIQASEKNRQYMENIRHQLVDEAPPPHCCPSNEEEARQFLCLPDKCSDHLCYHLKS